MTFLLLFLSLFLLYLLLVELYPFRKLKVERVSYTIPRLPDLYLYSFQIHVHSQFSYDSLGKPEDIIRSAKEENIDFVVVTDHENDSIKHFAGERLIAGMEKKVLGEGGKVLGDLLLVGDLKVVAHPFREKYQWRLELPEDYLFEIVDLKDALLERKGFFLFLIPYVLSKTLISRRLFLDALKKLIDIRRFARLYLKMGISNPVVGGLDHHVKFYLREVGIRFLFPDYLHSFRLMRNFLLVDKKLKDKNDFIEGLKRGRTLLSFSKKPTLYWKEGGLLKILPSTRCLLVKMSSGGEEFYEGACFELKPTHGMNLFLGYTYSLRIGSLYLGLKPLFLFAWKEAEDPESKKSES
ncbi:MAG: PHP domain-containing protein [Aquificaceae bacterium]|nr:PHP domain-containing protein [Aquificaceae bacterium]